MVVFRRNREPYQTNTRNSFVERDFYGPPLAAVVDNLITDEETRLGPFLTFLRSYTVRDVIGANQDATDFVLQMSIRGRWIRDIAGVCIRRILERIYEALSDRSRKTAIYSRWFDRNPEWLREGLMKNAVEHFGRPPSSQEKDVLEAMESALRENPEKLAEFGLRLPKPPFIQESVEIATEQGHLKGLENSLRMRATPFRAFLEQMQWSVVLVKQPVLILGDCGPMFLDAAGMPLGPIGVPDYEQVKGVALPISSRQLLTGRLSSTSPDPAEEYLNVGSAAWSSEAFIASADTRENRALHSLLASRLTPQLEALVQSALQQHGIT